LVSFLSSFSRYDVALMGGPPEGRRQYPNQFRVATEGVAAAGADLVDHAPECFAGDESGAVVEEADHETLHGPTFRERHSGSLKAG
jgi:hypothetical protein